MCMCTYTNMYIHTVVYDLFIGVHSVCKLCVWSCKEWDTMTMSVHGHAVAYLQLDLACLKKGCLLIAQPLARARRFNTTQMAPAASLLHRKWSISTHQSSSPSLLSPDHKIQESQPLLVLARPRWSLAPQVEGQEMLLTRHEAKEHGVSFFSPLLPSVHPELAVSCVPSARHLASLASSSTVGSNWKCMSLYNLFYWPLLSPGNIRMVIIHSALLLHGKMDFLLPLLFSVLFLKKSK